MVLRVPFDRFVLRTGCALGIGSSALGTAEEEEAEEAEAEDAEDAALAGAADAAGAAALAI
jgi:hypothetical protein